MVTPPKTNPVFFSLPPGFDGWPELRQREWMERQAEVVIAKLKPEAAQGGGGPDG